MCLFSIVAITSEVVESENKTTLWYSQSVKLVRISWSANEDASLGST